MYLYAVSVILMWLHNNCKQYCILRYNKQLYNNSSTSSQTEATNSANSSEREDSPDNAAGAIPKIQERNSHQNNRAMAADELQSLNERKELHENLTNAEDTHRQDNSQVSTNGNAKNGTNEKKSKNSEGDNNLYDFHTCASAQGSDTASNTNDQQNTLTSNENRSITPPGKEANARNDFITPEKLSTAADKEELGLSSPYVLLKSEVFILLIFSIYLSINQYEHIL